MEARGEPVPELTGAMVGADGIGSPAHYIAAMTALKDFVRAIRDAPIFAHALALATLAIWIVKACWLDFVETDSNILVGMGHVVDGLLSAVIAGYVFFILFAVFPDYRQRRIMAPFLFERIRSVVGDCMGIIDEINRATAAGISFSSATKAQVIAAFSAVKTTTNPNILAAIGVPMSWPAFFVYRADRTKEAIGDLFEQSRFLDAEVIELLTRIRSATFYQMSAAVARSGPISNPDLSFIGPNFYKLVERCRELADWHDTNVREGQPLIAQGA